MEGDWIDGVTELLFDSSFMTLSTADGDGRPWASPVEFVCDEGLSFYWRSPVDARHSQNIRINPRAAFSIYDSTQVAGANAIVQGLYGEGQVDEIVPRDVEAIMPAMARWISWRDSDREAPRDQSGVDIDESDSPWRVYRLTPSMLYALDPSLLAEGKLVESRLAVDLTASFSRAYRSRSS